jgi:multiple sugar transport system permease protein/putative aldouronate transport system permease protein
VGFTFDNYKNVFALNGVGHAILVSVARTASGTALTVFCCMFAGYIFSKQDIPGRKFFYRMLVITMYLSAGLIPRFLVYRAYGLLNTFWVFIIPSMISAYNVILIKTYIEQLPASIEESAKIDGAGTLTIFFKIILPMSLPIAATIAIFAAVGQWNSWFDNHIYAYANKNLMTLQYMLYRYLTEAERLLNEIAEQSMITENVIVLTPWNIRMTVTMVTVIPVLLIYPFLQRYFIKGIVVGAVKG